MSICIVRLIPSNGDTSNAIVSGKEMWFHVPPKTFRLDGRIAQRTRHRQQQTTSVESTHDAPGGPPWRCRSRVSCGRRRKKADVVEGTFDLSRSY